MTAPLHKPTGDAAQESHARPAPAVTAHDDGSFTVHGHAAVRAAALDDATFSSAVSRHLQIPNGLDGAEHSRDRALIERYFTPQAMAEFEPLCRQAARESVEALPRGEAFDVSMTTGWRSFRDIRWRSRSQEPITSVLAAASITSSVIVSSSLILRTRAI